MSGYNRDALRIAHPYQIMVYDQVGNQLFSITIPGAADNPLAWAERAFSAIAGWEKGDSVISSYKVVR